MNTKSTELAKQINFIVYSMPDADVKVNTVLKNETIWLSQKGMSELFGCSSDNIGLHLKNIFESGELEKNRTAEDFSVVQKEGSRYVNRKTTFYNLEKFTGRKNFKKRCQHC